MISPRKRRIMLRNINNFFQRSGKLLTETEYRASSGTPYRLDQIQRYLGGWKRMRASLFRYYPKWREQYEAEKAPEVQTKVVFPETKVEKDPLAELKAKADKAKTESDEDE